MSNSLNKIGDSTFAGCWELLSISIPNSVKEIGESAFECCESLDSVAIPNSVKSIGDYAFNGCCNLRVLVIPSSVTSIGECAFVLSPDLIFELDENDEIITVENAFCSIESVYSLLKDPANVDCAMLPFGEQDPDSDEVHILYVLPGLVEVYKNLEGWNVFTDIREMSEEMYKKLMGDEQTFIASTDADSDIRVIADDDKITVLGAKPDTTVRVYDISGRLVAVHSINDGLDIRIDAKGTYVVKVGDTTYKMRN